MRVLLGNTLFALALSYSFYIGVANCKLTYSQPQSIAHNKSHHFRSNDPRLTCGLWGTVTMVTEHTKILLSAHQRICSNETLESTMDILIILSITEHSNMSWFWTIDLEEDFLFSYGWGSLLNLLGNIKDSNTNFKITDYFWYDVLSSLVHGRSKFR